MKTAETIVTYVFGLVYLIFGLNFFFEFIPIPEPDGKAGEFMEAIDGTGFMVSVKIVEIVVALMLLLNIKRPLAWLLILPVSVNIMMYDVFLMGTVTPPAALVFILNLFMVYRMRENYSCLFK